MSPFSPTCYLTEHTAVKFVKKVFGEKDIEAILQRLNRLTEDEARTIAAQTLEVVYSLVQNMTEVMNSECILDMTLTMCGISFPLDRSPSANSVREALGKFHC